MIHTNRTVTVGNQESIIDSPIILYRGDREVEVEFTLNGNKFTFTNGGNVIKSTNATHGQLVINTPTGENMFSEITECREGKVVFLITKEMIDELVEIGFYSFQIRLFDESQVSRVTIPPVFQGIDIRNPIAAEDETNVVDIGLVDYAIVQKDEYENLATFLPDGSYNKTDWESRGLITEAKLDKIEDALYTINENMEASDLSIFNRIERINQNVNRQITEFRNEADAEIEAFERSVNTNVERFKIDVTASTTQIREEIMDDIEEIRYNTPYVTPEMFGAIGDGITDDSVAFQDALNSNKNTIIARGIYKITQQLRVNTSKTICGGGKFISPSSDDSKILFYCHNESSIIDFINVRDLQFESIRDNNNVYPPKGHTRDENCLSSNIFFLCFSGIKNVDVRNVQFEGGEYDINSYNVDSLNVSQFKSNNASMHLYCANTEKVNYDNGSIKLYDYLGSGDHHFYICYGNGDVNINNVNMTSGESSGTYAIHAYAEDDQISQYGKTKNVNVNNCIVTCLSFFASVVEEDFNIKNTIYNQISSNKSLFYATNGMCCFDNVTFNLNESVTLSSLVTIDKCLFENCKITNRINFNTTSCNFEFNNCSFQNTMQLTSEYTGNVILNNCIIRSSGGYALYSTHSGKRLQCFNCGLYSNGDGVISVRSDGEISLYNCYGDNDKATKMFNYSTPSCNPTFNLYNCIYPTLSIRTSDTGTTINRHNCVFAE